MNILNLSYFFFVQKGLKEGVDELQAPVSENDLANMFSNVNLEVNRKELVFLSVKSYTFLIGRR